VPVAREDRVLRDLARFLPFEQAKTLLFRVAQCRGAARTVAVLGAASGLPQGYRGAQQVRQLLEELGTGAHSDAEKELVRLMQEAGITGYIVNYPVRLDDRLVRIDVAFPGARLAVEVDGRAFHSTADRFQGDRTRQNGLVAAGWRVLRFTWADLIERPGQVIARILSMLG
jgi:very-short-patch-repair endonuclease